MNLRVVPMKPSVSMASSSVFQGALIECQESGFQTTGLKVSSVRGPVIQIDHSGSRFDLFGFS